MFNDLAFAFQPDDHTAASCLAVTSSFKPIAVVKNRGENFLILEDPAESARAIAAFQNKVGIRLISPLISQGLQLGLSESGLKRFIQGKLSKISAKVTGVDWKNLTKKNNAVYLSYIDRGKERTAQYYVPEGQPFANVILEPPAAAAPPAKVPEGHGGAHMAKETAGDKPSSEKPTDFIALASGCLKRCDFTGAIGNAEMATRIDPDSRHAPTILAQAFFKIGQFDKAIGAISDDGGMTPKPMFQHDAVAHVTLAKILSRTGRADDAIRILSYDNGRTLKLLLRNNAFAHVMLANILDYAGRPEDAIRILSYDKGRTLKSLLQRDIFAHNTLANILDRAGRPEYAIRILSYDKGSTLKPLLQRDIFAYNTLANILDHAGRPEDAIRILSDDGGSTPKPLLQRDVFTHVTLAHILDRAGRFEDAIRILSDDNGVTLKGLLKSDIVAHNTLANILDRAGRFEDAIRILSGDNGVTLKGLLKSDIVAHNTLAHILDRAGKPEDAIRILSDDNGVTLKGLIKSDIVAHNTLAHILDRAGKPEDAIRILSDDGGRALKQLFQRDAIAHNTLANILDHAGRSEDAIRMLSDDGGRTLKPLFRNNAVAHNTLANILDRAGRFEDAIRILSDDNGVTLKGLFYRNAVVYNTLANILGHAGRFDDAISILSEDGGATLKGLFQRDVFTHITLANILDHAGRAKDAIRILSDDGGRTLKPLFQRDIVAHNTLANILDHAGRPEYAIRILSYDKGSTLKPLLQRDAFARIIFTNILKHLGGAGIIGKDLKNPPQSSGDCGGAHMAKREGQGPSADGKSYVLSDRRAREDPGADYASARRLLEELLDIYNEMERIAKKANRTEDEGEKRALKSEWVAGLKRVEEIYRSIDVSVEEGADYIYYKIELQKLADEVRLLYKDINAAFIKKDKTALFKINKKLVSANRRRLKMQLLAALLIARGKSELKDPKMIRNAACKAINGALYSCQRLKEELSARAARLQVIGRRRRYPAVTEEGERRYVFKVGDYDIRVDFTQDGKDRKETYRKGVWIKVDSRLAEVKRAVRQERYKEAQAILAALRDVYSGRAFQMQPKYREVRDAIDALMGWIGVLSQGRSPPTQEEFSETLAKLIDSVGNERHKIWQDIETDDVLAAKLEIIKNIPLQYVETCRVRTLLEYYIERITWALRTKQGRLSKRDRQMVLTGLGEIQGWLNAGIVDEKYFSSKDIAPAIGHIEGQRDDEARLCLVRIRERLDKRIEGLNRQKRALDEQVLAIALARKETAVPTARAPEWRRGAHMAKVGKSADAADARPLPGEDGQIDPDRDMKGNYATDSDIVVRGLLAENNIIEIEYDGEKLNVWKLEDLKGVYHVGVTPEEEYRGSPININLLLTRKEQENLIEWILSHTLSPPERGVRDTGFVRFRISLNRAALQWINDIGHSNISHAGYRDRCVYIGAELLKLILMDGREGLRKDILDDDEYWHLIDPENKDHVKDEAYYLRMEHVEEAIAELHPEEALPTLADIAEHAVSSPPVAIGDDAVALQNLDLNNATFIGEGRFGRAFLVRHKTTGRNYAVKIYCNEEGKVSKKGNLDLIAYQMRLCREHQGLISKGLMPYYYVKGECYLDGNRISETAAGARSYAYAIMDYIPGRSLEKILEKKGGADSRRILKDRIALALAIAEVASEYHRERLVVKELKPANIVVRPDNSVCIIDQEGVVPTGYDWIVNEAAIPRRAKFIRTSTHAKYDTPFMDREPFGSEEAQRLFVPEWDVYSFGVTLAEILDPYLILAASTDQEMPEDPESAALIARSVDINIRDNAYKASHGQEADARLLSFAKLMAFKIAKECIAKDDNGAYKDMSGIIRDLEKCIAIIDERAAVVQKIIDIINDPGSPRNWLYMVCEHLMDSLEDEGLHDAAEKAGLPIENTVDAMAMLIRLGIAEKIEKGDEAKYRITNSCPPWELIRPMIMDLGANPAAEEIEYVAGKIRNIIDVRRLYASPSPSGRMAVVEAPVTHTRLILSPSAFTRNKSLRRAIARKIGEGHRNKKVLSVGIGPGILEIELRRTWRLKITGVDVAEPMLAIARKNGEGRISLKLASGEYLPFDDESFDIVVLPESIGHMELSRALAEAYRVLKPGGAIHITTIGPTGTDWGGSGYKPYGVGEILSAMKECGFKDAEPLFLHDEKVNDCLYVKAEKPRASFSPTAPGAGTHMARRGVPAGVDIEGAEKSARDFVEDLKLRAIEAKDLGQSIILGLEESWLKDLSRPEPIIRELERLQAYLKKRGLDNVIFVRGNGDEVAKDIQERRRESGNIPLSNIIVIGSQSILGEKSKFNELKAKTLEESALLVAIDPANLKAGSAIMLVDMCRVAGMLRDGRYNEISAADRKILGVTPVEGYESVYIFKPTAPYDINEFGRAEKIQAQTIRTQA